MRRASDWLLAACWLFLAATVRAEDCTKPVYLTLDTGHMGVAEVVAQVLQRQQVRVTFFAANERTMEGDGSLGVGSSAHWAAWWRARAAEGHAFASHTLNHTYWRADLPQPDGSVRFRVRASAGPQTGQDQIWDAARYCAEIKAADTRLREVTGVAPLPLYRAPGGKTSPALLAAARNCAGGGYLHVGWSDAGFLGDELPSDKYPNDLLLRQALRDIRAGDVLLAHLGIWSRQEPWAPAVLEPLIEGLKQRGFCFRTLRDHPDFRAWIATHPPAEK
ncbi:polysaccharide deacetylase family protein [Hylemonella gracilis]|uniref:Polysaccharide deacetylase family protein n=1 Tax=Hylemonella gracilis TaxID=80880 RepID=A0A4P6UNJ6_9BURK|nr:polysaccharide deacetylase family protein [Hylemonella gracilis]QBK05171.1 polysaccharide deacetylase family protein [Hylemonella gracilis]